MAANRPTGNLLLDSITNDERDALLQASHRTPLKIGDIRRRPGDRVETVFFPTSGTLSIIVEQPEDGDVEAATIGREGAADLHAALGSGVAAQIVLAQIEGESIDVGVEAVRKVYDEGSTFRRLVHGYVEALYAQTAISVACVATHHLNARCARWLLETHDRVDSDTFELKQEFLAMMLAVHRPSVSLAAGALQASGLIKYQRGHITIIDREGLEEAACASYEMIRSEYSRLVPLR